MHTTSSCVRHSVFCLRGVQSVRSAVHYTAARMQKFFSNLFKKEPHRSPNDPQRYNIDYKKPIGKGSFGEVYKGKDRESKKAVAVKKIPVDARAEEELQFNLQLNHGNVTRMLGHFRQPDTQLHLVLEYTEKTLYQFMEDHKKKGKPMDVQKIALYTFQIFRSLHYLHSLSSPVIHRDVKPGNFLINPKKDILKVCDFGSAVRLVQGNPRTAAVVAKPYRAPELELGSEDYSEKIDIWAAGCILAELFINDRLFKEQPNGRIYKSICALLGDPGLDDIFEMLPLARGQPFPIGNKVSTLDARLKSCKPPPPPDAVALIKRILQFKPPQRPSAIDCCANPFYNQLRQKKKFDKILYNFNDEEIANVPAPVLKQIVPGRCRKGNVLKKITEYQIWTLHLGSQLDVMSVASGGSGSGSASGSPNTKDSGEST